MQSYFTVAKEVNSLLKRFRYIVEIRGGIMNPCFDVLLISWLMQSRQWDGVWILNIYKTTVEYSVNCRNYLPSSKHYLCNKYLEGPFLGRLSWQRDLFPSISSYFISGSNLRSWQISGVKSQPSVMCLGERMCSYSSISVWQVSEKNSIIYVIMALESPLIGLQSVIRH